MRWTTLDMFKSSSEFYRPFQCGASFVILSCYLCFTLVFIILSCLFLVALLSPAGKWLTSWLSCVWWILVFLSLSHMVFRVWCSTGLIPELCLLLYFTSIGHLYTFIWKSYIALLCSVAVLSLSYLSNVYSCISFQELILRHFSISYT